MYTGAHGTKPVVYRGRRLYRWVQARTRGAIRCSVAVRHPRARVFGLSHLPGPTPGSAVARDKRGSGRESRTIAPVRPRNRPRGSRRGYPGFGGTAHECGQTRSTASWWRPNPGHASAHVRRNASSPPLARARRNSASAPATSGTEQSTPATTTASTDAASSGGPPRCRRPRAVERHRLRPCARRRGAGGLGLDRHQLIHARWKVLEVDPVPRADLDHATGEAGGQLVAQPVLPPALVLRNEPIEEAREDRVLDV